MALPSGALLFQGKIHETVGFLVCPFHSLLFVSSSLRKTNDEHAKVFSLFVMVVSESSGGELHYLYCYYFEEGKRGKRMWVMFETF